MCRTRSNQRPVFAPTLSRRTHFGTVCSAHVTGATGSASVNSVRDVGPRAVVVTDLCAARGGLALQEITYGTAETSKSQESPRCQDAVTPSTGAEGADASKAVRGGIAQPVTPSPELGAIVGMEPLSRAELTKRVWAYIKAHELQDAQDRRQIHADATLKKVLGRDQVSMFEMPKLLNQHVK